MAIQHVRNSIDQISGSFLSPLDRTRQIARGPTSRSCGSSPRQRRSFAGVSRFSKELLVVARLYFIFLRVPVASYMLIKVAACG